MTGSSPASPSSSDPFSVHHEHCFDSSNESDDISSISDSEDDTSLLIEQGAQQTAKLTLPSSGRTATITPMPSASAPPQESVMARASAPPNPGESVSAAPASSAKAKGNRTATGNWIPSAVMSVALPVLVCATVGLAASTGLGAVIAFAVVLAVASTAIGASDFSIKLTSKEDAEKYMERYINDLKDDNIDYKEFIKNNPILSKPKHLEIKDDNAIKMNTFRKDALSHTKQANALAELKQIKDDYEKFLNSKPPADEANKRAEAAKFDQQFERIFQGLKDRTKQAIAKEMGLSRDLQASDLKHHDLNPKRLDSLINTEKNAAKVATDGAKKAFEDLRESTKDKELHEVQQMLFTQHGLQGEDEPD